MTKSEVGRASSIYNIATIPQTQKRMVELGAHAITMCCYSAHVSLTLKVLGGKDPLTKGRCEIKVTTIYFLQLPFSQTTGKGE